MKILYVSSVSATFELENQEIYYCKERYNVFLDSQVVLSGLSTNVFSLYDLTPNTIYKVKVNDKEREFKTLEVLLVSYKGKNKVNTNASIKEHIIPPTEPSIDFFGLKIGAILCFPNNIPVQ